MFDMLRGEKSIVKYDIPEGWKTIPLKHLVNANKETLSEDTPDDFEFLYVDIGSVAYGKGIEYFQKMLFKDAPSRARRVVHEKDVILSTVRTYLKSTAVIPLSNTQIIVSTGFLTLTATNGIIPEFLKYSVQLDSFVSEVESRSVGINYPVINASEAINISIILPPIEKQLYISECLDKKCNQIDFLISDIHKQIEILEKYEKSVITKAVTKGLNPNVEMKDSGISYVGNIPATWKIHPLYYYFGERKNKNNLGKEENLLSLSYGKIIRKDITLNGGLLPESFTTYNIVEKDDIIIRPTDLQNDKRSLRTGLVKEHGIITSAYITLKRIKQINVEYVHYLLHAFDVMKVFYNMGNGVRQGLNYSEFSRLQIFEPSIMEQDEIVSYLNKKCAEIDFVLKDKQEQLKKLAEYKKSLIFEYVTGKKGV